MTLLLFLASRSMMQPYLYYPEIDKLIWFKDPTYGPPQREDNGFSTVHGVLYATQVKSMIDANVSVSLSRFSLAPHSGWKETFWIYVNISRLLHPSNILTMKQTKRDRGKLWTWLIKVKEMYHKRLQSEGLSTSTVTVCMMQRSK